MAWINFFKESRPDSGVSLVVKKRRKVLVGRVSGYFLAPAVGVGADVGRWLVSPVEWRFEGYS